MKKTASNDILNDMNKILQSNSFKSLFKGSFASEEADKKMDENDAATKFTPGMAADHAVDEVPGDYSECYHCGFDHEYAPAESSNYHKKHPSAEELEEKGMNEDLEDCSDMMYADDSVDEENEEKMATAFDLALNNLLQASSALEHAGFTKGATVSLRLASLVVEAKKKSKEEKDKEKAEKAAKKEKAAKDKAAAKEKAEKEKEAKKAKEMKAKEDMQKAKDKKLAKDKAEKEKAFKEMAKAKAAKEKAKADAKK